MATKESTQKQTDNDLSFRQNFYCNLTIKDIPVVPANIISLSIREWIFDYLPKIHIALQDDGLFNEINTLEDGDVIKVELARTPEEESTFNGEFMLMDWKVNNYADNRIHFIEITGILNIPNLFYPNRCRSFNRRTSLDTLIDVASGLGINTTTLNNFSTNDNQNWLQVNCPDFQFIKHVTNRAYRENDAIFTYFNSSKEMFVTSLNAELEKQEVLDARYNLEMFTNNNLTGPDLNTLWYSYYDFVNTNGYMNKICNYGVDISWWDLEESQSRSIQDDSHRFSEFSFKNANASFNQPVENKNYGFQSSNVHDNFILAMNQNKYIRNNFFAYSMVLNAHASVPVKLMDTVMLSVPTLPYIEPNEINELLSGKYLVGGIIYAVGKGTGFQKHISLHRNGLNRASFQLNYKVS